MPLSCECYEDDCDYYWDYPEDFSEMPLRKRRARCKSCNTLINSGDVVAEFPVSRPARGWCEEKIFGDDYQAVPMASHWLCEECADLWFNFHELGFCAYPNESQRELLEQYHSAYGLGAKKRCGEIEA